MANKWKVLAIIFICLFIMETAVIGWGYYQVAEEQEKTMDCYYTHCSDYVDAYYDIYTEVCSCFDYDNLGELRIFKEIYLG